MRLRWRAKEGSEGERKTKVRRNGSKQWGDGERAKKSMEAKCRVPREMHLHVKSRGSVARKEEERNE